MIYFNKQRISYYIFKKEKPKKQEKIEINNI